MRQQVMRRFFFCCCCCCCVRFKSITITLSIVNHQTFKPTNVTLCKKINLLKVDFILSLVLNTLNTKVWWEMLYLLVYCFFYFLEISIDILEASLIKIRCFFILSRCKCIERLLSILQAILNWNDHLFLNRAIIGHLLDVCFENLFKWP